MSSVQHRQFEEQIDTFILQLIRTCWVCNRPPPSESDGQPNWITSCAHCVCSGCLFPGGVYDGRRNQCAVCGQENVQVTAVGDDMNSEIGDHFLPLFSSLDNFSAAVKVDYIFQLNAMAGRIQNVDNRFLSLKREHKELQGVHQELQKKHQMQIQTLISVRDELLVKRQYEREVEVLKSEIEHLRKELKINPLPRRDDVLEKSPFRSFMDTPMKRKAAEEAETARAKNFRRELDKSVAKPPPIFSLPPQTPRQQERSRHESDKSDKTLSPKYRYPPENIRRQEERPRKPQERREADERFVMPPPKLVPAQDFRRPHLREKQDRQPEYASRRKSDEYRYDQPQRPKTYNQRPMTYDRAGTHNNSVSNGFRDTGGGGFRDPMPPASASIYREQSRLNPQTPRNTHLPHMSSGLQTPRNKTTQLPYMHNSSGHRVATADQYARPLVYKSFQPLHRPGVVIDQSSTRLTLPRPVENMRREEREETSPYFDKNSLVAPPNVGGQHTESLADLLHKGRRNFNTESGNLRY